MNSNVPNDALDHMMVEPMAESTNPVVNQTPSIPVSATADPLYNIIFDTPSTTSKDTPSTTPMEESSPAAVIVSNPSSYTEPSMTAVEVIPSMILTFNPETGAIEQANSDSAPSPPIDVDQLSNTSSPGRTTVDNKERCRQYRQRKKNENKSAEAEYDILKVRNIELKSKFANMEEQHKKIKKMVFASLKGQNNANLVNKIKLEFSFLDL